MGEEKEKENENEKVSGMCSWTVSSSEKERAPRVEKLVGDVMGYVDVRVGNVRVEVEGSEGEVGEVVSALKGRVREGREVEVKGVSVGKKRRGNRLDVRVVVKEEREGKWEVVGKVVGQVDVVPRVQVLLSARERAVGKASVEFRDSEGGETYKIVRSQIMGTAGPPGTTGLWVTDSLYVSYMSWSRWYVLQFDAVNERVLVGELPEGDRESGTFGGLPPSDGEIAALVGTRTVGYEGTLPSGIPSS